MEVLKSLNNRIMGQLLGGVVILIAILLAVGQHYNVYNFYGSASNKWYFWGLVGAIGLIGIIVAAWFGMKKQPSQEPVKSN